MTVNELRGASSIDCKFWIASRGYGSYPQPAVPYTNLDMLPETDKWGLFTGPLLAGLVCWYHGAIIA
jgi:hypothetical protein